MTHNPILEELYAIRERLLADAGGDLQRFLAGVRDREAASGRLLGRGERSEPEPSLTNGWAAGKRGRRRPKTGRNRFPARLEPTAGTLTDSSSTWSEIHVRSEPDASETTAGRNPDHREAGRSSSPRRTRSSTSPTAPRWPRSMCSRGWPRPASNARRSARRSSISSRRSASSRSSATCASRTRSAPRSAAPSARGSSTRGGATSRSPSSGWNRRRHVRPAARGGSHRPGVLPEVPGCYRPDVMLTYGGDPITHGMIALARRRGIPVVFAIHNFGYTQGPAVRRTSITASSPRSSPAGITATRSAWMPCPALPGRLGPRAGSRTAIPASSRSSTRA